MNSTLTSAICKLVAFNDNIVYRRQLYAASPLYFTSRPIIDKFFPLSYWNEFFERNLTADPTLTDIQLLRAVPGVVFTLNRFPFEFHRVVNSPPDTSPENMLYIDLIFKDWRVAGAGVKPVFEGNAVAVRLGNSILDLIKNSTGQKKVYEFYEKLYEIVDPNDNDPPTYMEPIWNYWANKSHSYKIVKDSVKPVEITPTLVTDPIKTEPRRLRSGKTY